MNWVALWWYRVARVHRVNIVVASCIFDELHYDVLSYIMVLSGKHYVEVGLTLYHLVRRVMLVLLDDLPFLSHLLYSYSNFQCWLPLPLNLKVLIESVMLDFKWLQCLSNRCMTYFITF